MAEGDKSIMELLAAVDVVATDEETCACPAETEARWAELWFQRPATSKRTLQERHLTTKPVGCSPLGGCRQDCGQAAPPRLRNAAANFTVVRADTLGADIGSHRTHACSKRQLVTIVDLMACRERMGMLTRRDPGD